MSEQTISRRVEEALFFKLKEKAFQSCKDLASAYADCCKGRSVSMVWACQKELRALSACLGQHTNPDTMNELKRRWMEAGQPHQSADWEQLLRGL